MIMPGAGRSLVLRLIAERARADVIFEADVDRINKC